MLMTASSAHRDGKRRGCHGDHGMRMFADDGDYVKDVENDGHNYDGDNDDNGC